LPVLLWILILLLPGEARASGMGGPGHGGLQGLPDGVVDTSPVKLGLQGLVRLYQTVVSPVNPDRCGFRPSCSAYGSLAVRENGPFWGVIMTADRLLRCHLLKKPGPAALLLPDGKILDLPPPKPLLEFSDP
jgi:putative membrane protein insertion efficiency factor